MSEKIRINKNHPKYEEYISKCRKISEAEDAEIEECRAHSPLQLDGPEGAIHRKYIKRIKALQEEYSFLFEEEK